MDTWQQYERHPALQYLIKAVRREWWLQVIICGCLIVSGMVLLIGGVLRQGWMAVAGIVFAGLGFRWLYRTLFAGENLLLRQLRRHPVQIVWVYSVVVQAMPFGLMWSQRVCTHFWTVSGEQHCLYLPARHYRVVNRLLQRLLPHATFGYSPEREAQYQADPETLRR